MGAGQSAQNPNAPNNNGKKGGKEGIKTSEKKGSGGKFAQSKFNNKKASNKSGSKAKKNSKSTKKLGKKQSSKKGNKKSGKKGNQKKDSKKAGTGQKKQQKKTSGNAKKNSKATNKQSKNTSSYVLTAVVLISGMIIIAILAYYVWKGQETPPLPPGLYSLWGARQARDLR